MIPRRDLKFIGHGFLMGGADIIPGVSGGTVALILGIYRRLVTAISRFDLEFLRSLRDRRWLAAADRVDGGFLGALLIGIALGIISLASLMNYLLHNQRQHTYAVFFGLILASSWIVARLAGRMPPAFWLLTAAAAVGAYWFVGLPFLESPPEGLWYVFACGSVAICAMILPGVSGAFVLLLLGTYVEVTGALRSLLGLREIFDSLTLVVVFLAGCAVGIVSFSKFLRWLLARFERPTLAVLCGLMLGSLRKIWPFKLDLTPQVHELNRKQFVNLWPDTGQPETWLSFVLMVAAAALVIGLEVWSRRVACRAGMVAVSCQPCAAGARAACTDHADQRSATQGDAMAQFQTKFCHACGESIDARAEICPRCGVRQPGIITTEEDREMQRAASNKLAAGLCGIFLGALGIHKFILGLTTPALIMLLVSVLTCGMGAIPMGIIGLVEGIIYLTKTDEEFHETYVVEKRGWF